MGTRGVLHARPLRARATEGTPAVPQCAHTFHGTCTGTRKLTIDSHAPTRAARVRARRRKGELGRCSHTRPHGAHWASTHVPRHARQGGADRVLHLLAAGVESTRRGLAGVRRSCALGSGAGTRGPPRLGYGTRTAVGARSVFLTTRRVLGGYSRGTHGPVRGMTCAGQWNGPCGALATGTHKARAREGVLPTIPSTPRRWAAAGGLLPAYIAATCGEGTRTAVRRCVHVRAHAAVRTDTDGPALARTRTGAASRGAGAQDTQQLERRQRGGDRAVERVRAEIPATCKVRPAVQ
jgi:hypothetical protein